MPETLRISEPADAVRCLSVNRPERRNALDRATCAALRAALAAAEADPGVRAILLTGTGGCFTSGNDLRDFRDTAETGEESAGLRFLRGLGACAKPVVAAVEGHAVGIGTTLLLHFAVAGAGARVRLPFVALGLSPEGASSYLLPLVAGHKRAAELLLMLGEPFGPEAALEAGRVTAVAPEGAALAAALARARALATLPPASVLATKADAARRPRGGRRADPRRGGGTFRALRRGPDAQAAFAAFLAR